VKLTERQAFLDGYRHGLGSAVRSVEQVIEQLPRLNTIDADVAPVIRSVLTGIVRGLRIISASAVLADPDGEDDE
jgi:hypothetical protein